MPRMDGLELIDAVVAEFDNLPIIVLSGTGVLADAIDALRRGAWDYLTKPIQDLAELEILVRRSLFSKPLPPAQLTAFVKRGVVLHATD